MDPASKTYISIMSTSDCLGVNTFRPVEPLSIEHVISMTKKPKTSIKCKLLQIQDQLDDIHTALATSIFFKEKVT
jgi:hypothetical protein